MLMTTKEIFDEAFWAGVLVIPKCYGSWPMDYKIENIRFNNETYNMDFDVSVTLVKPIEKIELDFEMSFGDEE